MVLKAFQTAIGGRDSRPLGLGRRKELVALLRSGSLPQDEAAELAKILDQDAGAHKNRAGGYARKILSGDRSVYGLGAPLSTPKPRPPRPFSAPSK